MPTDPNLYLPLAHILWKVRKALRCEGLVGGCAPARSFAALLGLFPARYALRTVLVEFLSRLGIDVIARCRYLLLNQVIINTLTVEVCCDISILCHHFHINLLLLLLLVYLAVHAECNGRQSDWECNGCTAILVVLHVCCSSN